MIHATKMSGTWYAVDVTELDQDEQNERISSFTSVGTPVILVGELEDLEEIGIELEEVRIVELE